MKYGKGSKLAKGNNQILYQSENNIMVEKPKGRRRDKSKEEDIGLERDKKVSINENILGNPEERK